MWKKDFLSMNILPNTSYTFEIQVRDKDLGWMNKTTETIHGESIQMHNFAHRYV
jgi:hypothetical protein